MLSHQKQLLVIEDEEPLLRMLQNVLQREGFQVLTAQNGALGLAAALEHHPHLILLDLLLPVMDGIAFLKKLRDDPWGKDAPVIVLTNVSDTEAIIEAVEFNTIRIVQGKKEHALSHMGVVQENMAAYLNTRVRNGVYDFLVKRNVQLKDVVARVKKKLAKDEEEKEEAAAAVSLPRVMV